MKTVVELGKYLRVQESSRQRFANRFTEILSSGTCVPSFSDAALKLCTLAECEDTTMDEFAAVVALDPGLATRCLQVASSIGFAARPIENIKQAMFMIGIREVRRIAFAVATIETFSHFRHKVNWRRFWLHNVLVARLADHVAGHFRRANGMEYLTGLLHDMGKLIIEHYCPKEFDEILTRAAQRRCSHIEVEQEILGLNHAQIGAALCERLDIHTHILAAVRYHHEPLNEEHVSDPTSDGGFLAACISVSDQLAHTKVNYTPAVGASDLPLHRLPEWAFLNRLAPGRLFEIDLQEEIEGAKKELDALLAE